MKVSFSVESFVGGLLLGVAIGAAWVLSPWKTAQAPIEAAPSAATSGEAAGAVSVHDQSAGNEVAVESVTVPPPGVWVAVREVNGSTLGNVLGAVLERGPRANVVVPLLRATEPGRRYAIELYRDDGNGSFDLGTDSVYVDFTTGERVIAYFTTRSQ